MNGICLYCQRALGCPLLFGKSGQFEAERLFTEEDTRLCSSFVEVAGARERSIRERMYKGFGLGYLRVLHELPELVMEGLRQVEKDELMYENIPNFQDPLLLWEGMTSVEREEVLRYQTDETGKVIVEVDTEGVEHKLARPEYHLKAYLCDPAGPIQADKAVAWLWHVNAVVDHILKVEAEQGLIVKVKKPSATSGSPEQPAESETKMPGRTVHTVRTNGATTSTVKPAAAPAAKPAERRAQPKPAPAAAPARGPVRAAAKAPAAPAAGGGKVGSPPPRRVATPAGAPGRVAARPTGAPTAPVAAGGVGISKEQLKEAIFEVVNPMFEELLNQAKLNHKTIIECATIIGDIAGQTGGKFQVQKLDEEGNCVVYEDGSPVMMTPQLWLHPSQIYAHVEGEGFKPENLRTVDGNNGLMAEEGEEQAEGAPVEEEQAEETIEGEA